MFNLEPDCCLREVSAFVDLCLEYEIKKVFVSPEVFQRIQELKKSRYAWLIFGNVQFCENERKNKVQSRNRAGIFPQSLEAAVLG